MSNRSFLDYVLDLLEPLNPLHTKKLFGGVAILKNNTTFAMVFNETLYLKTDDSNKESFVKYNSKPLSYKKKGNTINLRYLEIPIEILDDPEELINWCEKSIKLKI